MAGLLQTLTFASTGGTFDFLGSTSRVSAFEPTPHTRGESRPRMQAHGSWPRTPYFDELAIHQEGWLVTSAEGSALIAARDAFNNAVIGDMTATPTEGLSGTLTVKYEGWTENAHQNVIVESAEARLRVENPRRGCPYVVQWIAVSPYFVGSTSGLPHNL